MLSDFVWLLKERAVSHLRVFFWFSSKPGAKLKPLVMVITLNQEIPFWVWFDTLILEALIIKFSAIYDL